MAIEAKEAFMCGVVRSLALWFAVFTALVPAATRFAHAQSGLASRIDVTKLGADSTGRGDSTAALQKALASVAEGGGVYFPAGTYRISRQLATVRGNVVIEGEGERSVIEQVSDTSDGNGLSVRHNGVTVKNLKIRSVQRLRDHGTGILIRDPETKKGDVRVIHNAFVSNVVVEGFQYGITGSLLMNVRLEKNRVMVGTKAFEAKHRGSCIEVSGDEMIIRDNILGTLEGAMAEHNIYVAGGGGKSEERRDIQIINNTCGGRKRSCGIQAYNASWNNLRIEGNRIDMKDGGMHGIIVGFSHGGSPLVQQVNIIGNTIENVSSYSTNSGNGIALFVFTARRISIEKNSIRNTSNAAIRFVPADEGTGVDSFSISDNTFENWSDGNKGMFPAVLLHSWKGSPVMANGLIARNTYRPGGGSSELVRLNNKDKSKYRNVQVLDR